MRVLYYYYIWACRIVGDSSGGGAQKPVRILCAQLGPGGPSHLSRNAKGPWLQLLFCVPAVTNDNMIYVGINQ